MEQRGGCYFADNCTEKHERCMRVCHLYLQMNDMFERCYVPDVRVYFKQLSPTASKDFKVFARLQQIKETIKDFVLSGKNLFIYSKNFGNGKTTWAMKILFTYFHSWWLTNFMTCRGVYVNVPEFLTKLKQEHDDDFRGYLRDIEYCDCVVWDDISDLDGLTETDKRNLQLYICKRVANKRSNIYTSHLGRAGLEEILPNTITERIFRNCEVLEITGRAFEG